MDDFLADITAEDVKKYLDDATQYSVLAYFTRKYPNSNLDIVVDKLKNKSGETVFKADYIVKQSNEVFESEEYTQFCTSAGKEYEEQTGKICVQDKRWFNFVYNSLKPELKPQYMVALQNYNVRLFEQRTVNRLDDISNFLGNSSYDVKPPKKSEFAPKSRYMD